MFRAAKFRCSVIATGFLLLVVVVLSCVKIPSVHPPVKYESYLYPYHLVNNENEIIAELTLKLNNSAKFSGSDDNPTAVYIPPLKYNKSWLFLLTQDDCHHASYSITWALFNGRPLSYNYYYNAPQLAAGDLPPDSFIWARNIGSTDGAGNDVRFTFTFTLFPEGDVMNRNISVSKGYTRDYYRFHMQSSLVWDNVREMLNYDNGIAFHDVDVPQILVSNEDSICAHFMEAQKIVRTNLDGRSCKILAEPNGNKAYLRAGMLFSDICLMTAQNNDAAFNPADIFPLNDFILQEKETVKRWFYHRGDEYRMLSDIRDNLALPFGQRRAMQVGVHGTGPLWVELFSEISSLYGKDGDDSVWFTSLEEYYEYNHYRNNAAIETELSNNKEMVIRIKIPHRLNFYFPSLTINVAGISAEDVATLTTNNAVKGLSYATLLPGSGINPDDAGDEQESLMINIDCREFLPEHALHFTEKFELEEELSIKAFYKSDALYYIGKLKDSDLKNSLLMRLK